jgi:hypothetical protein
MTTKYFSECALLLTERWGSLSAPLYAVGATYPQVEYIKHCYEHEASVSTKETKQALTSVCEKAMSLPHFSMSKMQEMMSDPTLQTSITWPMVIEAYERKYDKGKGKRTLEAPSKQWIRQLIKGSIPKTGQKYPRMCAVFQELYDSLRTDNPSPTPARGAENAQKPAISGSGGVGGVVLMLIFALFGLSANAQTQPVPGKWQSLHIIHASGISDTITQVVTVSRWYSNCRDCDSMCIITNPTGQKCVWKVDEGRTMNGTQPVEWRNGAWWYVVASKESRVDVELLFWPVTNPKP